MNVIDQTLYFRCHSHQSSRRRVFSSGQRMIPDLHEFCSAILTRVSLRTCLRSSHQESSHREGICQHLDQTVLRCEFQFFMPPVLNKKRACISNFDTINTISSQSTKSQASSFLNIRGSQPHKFLKGFLNFPEFEPSFL